MIFFSSILKTLHKDAAINDLEDKTDFTDLTNSQGLPSVAFASSRPIFSKKIAVDLAHPLFVAAIALSLLGASLGVAANENERKLQVSATIAKYASLRVLMQPPFIVVTADDIAQGYVDVAGPAQVAVQNNTQSGYMLVFESQGEFLRQTLVKGLNTDLQLGATGGSVAQRGVGRGMSKTLLDLGFRFVLSDSAQQGVYAWPLRFSVTPL